ncbi:MAG TPA: hypothetical protein VNA88_07915 [Candidatus Kapabacteria bacterium]|nr:hypothetical protein [Candidatus Kapabacteria bacterium]
MTGHGPSSTLLRALLLTTTLILAGIASQPTAIAQIKTKETATKTIKASAGLTTARYSYFPTSSTTDGRFVSLVGANLQSMAGDIIEFGLGLPGSADSLRIGIFDGETSGLWDLGSTALSFKLYADSLADGTGAVELGSWSGSSMTDNGWFDITLAKNDLAKTSDTIYFYRLVVRLTDTTTKTWSNFKIRTNGTAALLPRAFAFAAPLFTTAEARILYPNYPATSQTTYNGTWKFFVSVPDPIESIEIWDGDMDYGSYDGIQKDTDDVDTPNSLPAWCMSSVARSEGTGTSNDFIIQNGVRSTTTRMTGAPADDNYNTWYRRSPSVGYTLTDPYGVEYENGNPSGNLEWERFRLSTILTSASHYDYYASFLPRGTYQLDLNGMDIGNLNAWRVYASMLGASDTTVLDSGAADTYGPTTTNFRFTPVFTGVDSSGNPIPVLVPTTNTSGGTGTWGWWQANGNRWTVNIVTVGGISYTRSEAVALMGNAGSDLCKRIARELIAAKLNVLNGNNAACIHQVIIDADAWLIANPIGTTNPNTVTGNPIYRALQRYNTGQSDCAGGNGSLL